MKAKHTLGTWKIEGNYIVGDRYIAELANWHLVAAGSQYEKEERKLRLEKEANARLIVSAPELLAQLKNTVNHACFQGISEAKAIIAKVEGDTK